MSEKVFAAYSINTGTAASRPATPTVADGKLYMYVATDTGQVSVWNGSAWQISGLSTQQVLTTGTAATYTTPAGCRQLRIRMYGGGGGGAGSGTATPTAAGDGGDTIFNSINAGGGKKGSATSSQGGFGGTSATGTASLRLKGMPGSSPMLIVSTATNFLTIGGNGGGYGGAPGGSGANAGAPGGTNTGGGGSGAGILASSMVTLATWFAPSGGGEGEYVELIINAPAGTYTYTIGAGGTAGVAGTSGNDGGAGGSGIIIVDEFY